MRKKIFPWLGREFVGLSCEGNAEGTVTEETQDIFRRIDSELKRMGFSLENTVRTRLWGRDRESRDLGSEQRVKILSGKARSASSSYIAPDHFDSNSKVSLSLRVTGKGRVHPANPPDIPMYSSGLPISGCLRFQPV